MDVSIVRVKHTDQRYSTCGDWQFDGHGNLTIKVSALGSWKEEALIALHEYVEAILCKASGVTERDVDNFDLNFKGDGEPGDAEGCPYRQQHFFATNVERMLADKLYIDWEKYNDKVENL